MLWSLYLKDIHFMTCVFLWKRGFHSITFVTIIKNKNKFIFYNRFFGYFTNISNSCWCFANTRSNWKFISWKFPLSSTSHSTSNITTHVISVSYLMTIQILIILDNQSLKMTSLFIKLNFVRLLILLHSIKLKDI